MDASTFSGEQLTTLDSPLTWVSLACAAISATILIVFLWKRLPLVHSTKIVLFFGIAVFPIGAAISGNIVGYGKSQERVFCGSCHVMTPYTDDSRDPKSKTLAAMHARNDWFGEKNCYTCHTDYGMFGTVTTKISALLHVYHYYATYRSVPLEQSLGTIRLYKPASNTACLRCHSTSLAGWIEQDDHRGVVEDVRTNQVLCASAGCHGPAHPFSKEAQ